MKLADGPFRQIGFRLFDLVCAAAGVVLAAPVMIFAALAILIEDGRPCLFLQQRIGLNGRPFRIWKLRTMRAASSGAAITSADDSRVTRVGAWLRKFKLDELPQLFNVLIGEMSLVGPRPEVPNFVDENDRLWKQVLAVRPGITDLASLIYRNEEEVLSRSKDPELFYRRTVLPAKLSLNIEYIRSRSLASDIKLLFLTVWYSFLPGRFEPQLVEEFLRERREESGRDAQAGSLSHAGEL